VLDLTRVLAGPLCTMTLADLGADVWKIEHPGGGDESRSWLPPDVAGVSTYFLAVNRNKRSVAVDLKTPEGLALVHALAGQADILVTNFLPAALARLELDWATLKERHPRLIYCTISGYGATGARAADAGYDFVIQGESGLMAITGEPAGEPAKLGVAITDILAGMNATQSILAALLARERSGFGQAIDIALLDGAIAALLNVASGALNSGHEPGRFGNAVESIVPYQTFATQDGAVVLAIGNDRQFRALCSEVMQRPDLADDVRYATNAARVANRTAIIAEIARHFAALPSRALLEALRRSNLPSGAIRSVNDALAAPEVLERGLIAEIAQPGLGVLRFAGSPLRLSANPVQPPRLPPRLGEHTREVLGTVLRLEPAELDRLERTSIIKS
jgi:crotonobetainyl-CoA:carnitine CoA-transferase CaiB-like acyl-CoA transferase